MFELNSCADELISLPTRESKMRKIVITKVREIESGRPFLLKKLYVGERIIAKKRDKRKGTIISEVLLTPAKTIITLAITMK